MVIRVESYKNKKHMKKYYIKPCIELLDVELEQIIASSVDINDTDATDDGEFYYESRDF